MILISHRVNSIESLTKLPTQYGVEIDIRGNNGKLFLSHDPIDPNKHYDELEDYLAAFKHAFIIFNTKEAGYENRIIELAAKYDIPNEKYFLLDVEYPYLYRATRKEGIREIAVRYSEGEPIESVEAQIKEGVPLLNWVWIDVNTTLPLTTDIVQKLKPFKTTLVCPSRWGRPEDIATYIEQMKTLNFEPTAVMTADELIPLWEAAYPQN